MADMHKGRIEFSFDGSIDEAGKRLDEAVRAVTACGLTIEAAGIDNPGAEDITPREQPPTEKP